MKKKLLIISLFLFIICSCSKRVELNKCIAILLDLSESTNKQEMRNLYFNSLKKILDRLNYYDALFIAPITEKSLVELEFIVEEKSLVSIRIPLNTNLFEEKKLKRKIDEEFTNKKEAIAAKVKNVLEMQNRKIIKTDILSSLNMVDQRIFTAYRNNNYNLMLVIMSDMIEDSSSYNFETENLSEEKIDHIISLRKKRGEIPDLNGVKVFVVGAYHPNIRRYNQIRKFWMRYLSECGANISEENYSSSCPIRICE